MQFRESDHSFGEHDLPPWQCGHILAGCGSSTITLLPCPRSAAAGQYVCIYTSGSDGGGAGAGAAIPPRVPPCPSIRTCLLTSTFERGEC